MTDPVPAAYVVGTAGHIDHGKSTLVKALTGIDPDRLEEEKRRGMTIDLGFAYFDLPTEPEVGVEREEFDEARRRLERAGFVLEDADRSWDHFVRLRQDYAGRVNALARYWATPPAQWIGDRSPLKHPRLHAPQPDLTQALPGARVRN